MTPEQQKLLEQLLELGDVTYIKSDVSIQELIAKAISEMDIELLETLVDNQLRNDKKKEFIEKIKEKFNAFKQLNDTYLFAHKGSCNGSWCNNYRSRGYSFTGNISNTFYNLIFEEVNGECSDICKCYSFKIKDKIINKTKKDADKKERESYGFTEADLEDLPF